MGINKKDDFILNIGYIKLIKECDWEIARQKYSFNYGEKNYNWFKKMAFSYCQRLPHKEFTKKSYIFYWVKKTADERIKKEFESEFNKDLEDMLNE